MSLQQIITTAMTGALLCGSVSLASRPAQAGLVGTGTNTVSADFFLGSQIVADEEFEDVQTGPGTFVAGPVTIAPGGVDFVEGANDLSTIHVGDTAIDITNLAPPSQPFCSVPTGSCPDSFTGFEFQFSPGVNITNVSVDPASAAAFLPIPGSLNFTSSDIQLNVAGDAPSPGDQLILDINLPNSDAAAVPEPATFSALAVGVIGLFMARRDWTAVPLRHDPMTRFFETRR